MVMIVEDDPIIRMILKKIILNHFPELHIEECENGREALSKVNESFKIIFTDNHMPLVSGMELVRALKKNKKLCKIPIIMVSVEGRDKEIHKGMDLGVSGWVVKPFREAQIVEYMDQYLT